MNYVDMAVGIKHCLDGLSRATDGRDAKDWALAAAVLIDKEQQLKSSTPRAEDQPVG